VGEQAEAVDEARAGVPPGLEAEGEDAAVAVPGEDPVGGVVPAARGQPGVVDPGDGRVVVEVPSDGEGVAAVALQAQGEGLEALQEQPGVERGDGA